MRKLLMVVLLAVTWGLVACGGSGTSNVPLSEFSSDEVDYSDPESVVRNLIAKDARKTLWAIEGSVEIVELPGGSESFIPYLVTAQRRANRESDSLQQNVEIDLFRPTGGDWQAQTTTPLDWQNTPDQAATIAQATAEVERRKHEEAESLINLEFPQTEGLHYRNSVYTVPVIIHNDNREAQRLIFRGTLRFPKGELLHFETFDFTISANSTEEYSIVVLNYTAQEWEIVFYKYLSASARAANSYADIEVSLVEWQLVIGDLEGKIHRIERPS